METPRPDKLRAICYLQNSLAGPIRRATDNTEESIKAVFPENQHFKVRIALQSVMKFFLANEYGISSAMSHASLYLKGFDTVEYACASSKDRCNYALSPSCADQMKLFRVLRFIVDENPNESEDAIDIIPLEVGKLSLGSPKLSWIHYKSTMDDTEMQPWDFDDPLVKRSLTKPSQNLLT